jgi:hypothetical protein
VTANHPQAAATAWATVRQSRMVTEVYVEGLLAIAAGGRLLPAQRRLLRLVWRDRDWIRPSLVRQVAAIRQRRLK